MNENKNEKGIKHPFKLPIYKANVWKTKGSGPQALKHTCMHYESMTSWHDVTVRETDCDRSATLSICKVVMEYLMVTE